MQKRSLVKEIEEQQLHASCQRNIISIGIHPLLQLVFKTIIQSKQYSMSFKPCSKDCISTEQDSCDEQQFEEAFAKTNPRKHKTQLCKTYSELGYCNYGNKCRFAHGREQLVCLPVSQHFRKRKCNGFWKRGYCLYGIRCQFSHAKIQWQDEALLKAMEGTIDKEGNNGQCCCSQSRLLKILDNKE